MMKKSQVLKILQKVKLDSLALQIHDGTWLSNIKVNKSQPDGMKLPPANLMRLVSGTTDAHRFIWSGRLTVTRILDLVHSVGIDFNQVRNLLDLGCGCGRLTRFFMMLMGDKVKVIGSDTDTKQIQWCKRNYQNNLASFVVNDVSQKLPFADSHFDMTICYSVFTHIKPEDQLYWFKEIGRVTRPGGIFVFSTQGYDDVYSQRNTSNEQLEKYKKGEMVSVMAEMGYVSESNYGIYHPRGSVEKLAIDSGVFEHLRTAEALKAPPMDSAGHNLNLWRKLP